MNCVSEQKSYFELVDSAKLSVRTYSRTHKHSDCEIICVLSGNVSVTLSPSGKVIRLSKGDLAVVPAGVLHSVEKSQPLSVFVSLKIDLSNGGRNDITYCFDNAVRCVAAERPAELSVTADKKQEVPFDRLFRQCIDEKENSRWGANALIELMICRVLVQIVRRWINAGVVDDSVLSKNKKVGIYTVCEYINSHFDEQIRVEALAELCSMSYTHFARRFKELYGRTCKEYIERVRIEKAKELLISTNHDLSFISQELGFSDCSHLIRIFKKNEGITPKQYRVSEKRK